MILENYTGAELGDNQMVASPDFQGDGHELAEMSTNALSEMHNLTVALARVEHKCLVESNQGLMEAGIKEFFTKVIETIKKWWNNFVAWLGSLWTKLKDVFVKRIDWLKRNEAAIKSASAEQLKGIKVKLGKKVFTRGDWAEVASKLVDSSKAVLTIAGSEAKKADGNAEVTIKEKLYGVFGISDASKAESKAIHDFMIGEEEEVELTPQIVGQLVKVAYATFASLDKLAAAKNLAKIAIAEAENKAIIDNDREVANRLISYIRAAGPKVQGVIAGYSSVVGSANSAAVSALVKALSAAGKKSEAKQEGTDVLAAFM